MNPNAAGLVSEPFEGALLATAKTHIPAADIGKHCDHSGLVSLARSCHQAGRAETALVYGPASGSTNAAALRLTGLDHTDVLLRCPQGSGNGRRSAEKLATTFPSVRQSGAQRLMPKRVLRM